MPEVLPKLALIVAHWRDMAATERATARQAIEMFLILLDRGIVDAKPLAVSGETKKALVLAYAGGLFDAMWPALILPGWASWLKPFLRLWIRGLALYAADATLQWLYVRYHKSPSAVSPSVPSSSPA